MKKSHLYIFISLLCLSSFAIAKVTWEDAWESGQAVREKNSAVHQSAPTEGLDPGFEVGSDIDYTKPDAVFNDSWNRRSYTKVLGHFRLCSFMGHGGSYAGDKEWVRLEHNMATGWRVRGNSDQHHMQYNVYCYH